MARMLKPASTADAAAHATNARQGKAVRQRREWSGQPRVDRRAQVRLCELLGDELALHRPDEALVVDLEPSVLHTNERSRQVGVKVDARPCLASEPAIGHVQEV